MLFRWEDFSTRFDHDVHLFVLHAQLFVVDIHEARVRLGLAGTPNLGRVFCRGSEPGARCRATPSFSSSTSRPVVPVRSKSLNMRFIVRPPIPRDDDRRDIIP